jgi:hypothetical protein
MGMSRVTESPSLLSSAKRTYAPLMSCGADGCDTFSCLLNELRHHFQFRVAGQTAPNDRFGAAPASAVRPVCAPLRK